jgi:glycosyltransferase involved in cell wall biosynthesis
MHKNHARDNGKSDKPTVSVIVPAFNEADRIGATLDALRFSGIADELVVVDDGSTDNTVVEAKHHGARVMLMKQNLGKGSALNAGIMASRGDVLVFLDADLGSSVDAARAILEPVLAGDCDMAVGSFSSRGGFGIIMRLARWGVRLLTRREITSPLSGQRALRREVLGAIYPLQRDFGVETAMLIDALRAGFRVLEVPVDMKHRELGRDFRGFLHRGEQGVGVLRAIITRLLRPRRAVHVPGPIEISHVLPPPE